MTDWLFTAVSIFSIAMAMGVVFAKNAVYSAFSLILTLFGLATLFLLWGNGFLATLQILIYAGAIVVLFVFVVMLLDITRASRMNAPRPLLGIVGGTFTWLFSLLLLRTLNHARFFAAAEGTLPKALEMRSLSKLLFTDYLWPFEVLSLFLLAMIIAIFILARPEEGGKA